MKILICDAFDASLSKKLAPFGEVTTDISLLPEANVALIRSKTKCTAEWLSGAKNLKLIIRGGVGLDNVDQVAAKAKGIEVRNTPEASSVAVAELAMALLLALPNHIAQGHAGMAKGEWLKKKLKRTELYGKTLGLWGVGRIGTEVAKRCAAFGMKVIAFDPYVKSHEIAQVVDLDAMLAQSDYISLHTPLTDETKGMVNQESIAKMKEGVRIVNTGRGGCINESDLVSALESGRVAGYGADVWLSDPPDPSCPILKAPNTVMLPHLGASTKENLLRIGDIVERIITEFSGK